MTESGSGCQAQWGEKLKVVGSCPALGGWDVAAAPDLHWTDGHVWTQAVEVPAGAKIEYKVGQEAADWPTQACMPAWLLQYLRQSLWLRPLQDVRHLLS